MNKLTEKKIIEIFSEAWNDKVQSLKEEIENSIISTELKVKHKSSGLLYTIDSIGPRDIMLRTPEGKKFLVSSDELEKEYNVA